MFKRIDHVEIIPADMEKTLDFYTRILGFKLKERHPARAGSPWKEIAYVTLNDTMVEVLDPVKPAPKVEPDHVGYKGMAIEVDNMDNALAYLKRNGVIIAREPMALGTSIRAEIKDPSGLIIELRQW